MAVENIGNLVPTKIPALIDDANIQDALKAYHYGSYTFDTAGLGLGGAARELMRSSEKGLFCIILLASRRSACCFCRTIGQFVGTGTSLVSLRCRKSLSISI